ncbi:MAG TPA: hypothetical protein VF598_05005, partial [Hymenobacter sp.]
MAFRDPIDLDSVNAKAELAQAAAAAAHAAADAAAILATGAQEDASEALLAAADAQGAADGKAVTYFQDNAPTGPVAGDAGDLWFDTNDGSKLYQWSGSAWILRQDAAAAAASAANAQVTANTKIVTFYQTSAPTALATGDLWVDTDDNNKLYRWSGSAWVDVRDLTISAAQAAANTAIANAASAQSSADGKAVTYFQTTAPTGLGAGDSGDLWFDTDDSNKLYQWSGSIWILRQDSAAAAASAAVAQAAANGAQITANSKITTFWQTSNPTALAVGDLWVDTDDNNRLYRWNGSTWSDVRDATIATALAAANAAIASAGSAQATADGKAT